MARAVNQTIAWIVALFLSLIVFGLGLAIVFSLKPKQSDDHGHTGDHEMAPTQGSHDKSEQATPHHPADSEPESVRPKIEHEDPHAKDGGEDEKEITPASVKAKTDGHSPEVKPQH